MAGIFGFFDYTKEGPGVDPDAPQGGAFATFFSILGRKFWKVITVNLLYVLTNIPALIVSFLVASVVFGVLFPGLTLESLNTLWDPAMLGEGQTAEQLSATVMLILTFVLAATSIGLGFVVTGPSHAGATYIMRNYAREDHAFLWSDFIEQARKNWKQSTVVSIVSTVLFMAVPVAMRFYAQVISNGILRTLMSTLLVLLFVTMAVMIMYIYQMLITFDLKLKQIVKNAWLFFILRLPFNIGILLAQIIFIIAIPLALLFFLGSIGLIITIFYYLLFAFGVNLLMVNFFINRQLTRFMIEPLLAEQEEEAGDYDYSYDEEEDDEQETDEEEDEEEETARDDGKSLPHPKGSPA